MSDVAVTIEGVGKKFRLYRERNQSLKAAMMRGRVSKYEDFWAIRDVTFDVPQGSSFALLGSNGSGKSTLLKCLAKIYYPEEGSITAHGRVASLLEVGSGFHPELSGRENIYLNGSILGMSRKEVSRKFDDIVEFSEIGDFIDQPVKNYSSGMYVRLGFSVAIHVEPDTLVVDELLAVGDAAFQEKSLGKFEELKRQGRTIILVSHDLDAVREMCDTAAWIEKGALREVGPVERIASDYIRSQLPPAEVFMDAFSEEQVFEMGAPLSGAVEYEANGGGTTQEYQKGLLCWSQTTGAHFVTPPIQQLLLASGGVEAHGWPVEAAQLHDNGTAVQHFELSTLMVPQDGPPRITSR